MSTKELKQLSRAGVVDAIRQAILAGELVPGQCLRRQDPKAARLALEKHPENVKEAMTALAQENTRFAGPKM